MHFVLNNQHFITYDHVSEQSSTLAPTATGIFILNITFWATTSAAKNNHLIIHECFASTLTVISGKMLLFGYCQDCFASIIYTSIHKAQKQLFVICCALFKNRSFQWNFWNKYMCMLYICNQSKRVPWYLL